MKIRYLTALACAIAFCLSASSASATDYCVGVSTTCSSPEAPFNFSKQGLLDAIALANVHAGADRVLIAEGTIDLTTSLQPTTSPGQKVEIIGAGVGKTIFNGTVSSAPQINWDFGDASSSASGFSVNVNGAVNGGSGMFVSFGTVSDVAVTEAQAANSGYVGVSLSGGATLQNATITNASDSAGGVFAQAGSATLTNVRLNGTNSGTGVYLNPSTAATFNLSRLNVSNFDTGVYATAGNVNLDDSLVDIGAGNADAGFYAVNPGSAPAPIVARVNRVTIVGTGTNQRGMQFGGGSPSGHFDGEFKDMLIYGTGSNFTGQYCSGAPSSGNPSWTYNDVVATNGGLIAGANCTIGYNTKIDLAATDPEFRDFAGGDYRLKWNSPLVDAGTSTGGTLDLAGDTRVVDGDGDSTAKVDLGAYEYQRRDPVVNVSAVKSSLAPLEATTFSGSASDADDESLTYSWKVDGADAVGSSSTLSIGFIAAGPHTVTFSATDEAGLTGSASVVVTVANPTPPACTADLKGFSLKTKPSKAFKRNNKGFAVVSANRKQPFFAISTISTVTPTVMSARITLQSVGKKKLKKLAGSQTLLLTGTENKLTFGGKWNKKKLKAGTYRATLTPVQNGECPHSLRAKVTFKLN